MILKRFDIDQNGNRLGLEDICALANKTAEEKYHGSYEGVGQVISRICPNHGLDDLQRYFEYVALSVLLKNGDAHLKNFSVIYAHPGSEARLSPLYDVVTTAVYKATSPRTSMNIIDRTLALNLNKSKSYPDMETLCEFGRKSCFVEKPEYVLERIEEAKLKVISDNRGRIDDGFLGEMAAAW